MSSKACPDCGEKTAVYKNESKVLPPGGTTSGTMCGNCGATVCWKPDKREVVLIRSGEDLEPYYWK